MTELSSVQAKKQANRKALKFVIVLLVLYFIFSQGNLFMNSVMEPTGKYYNAFISNHFDYIQGLKTALIKPAVWIIKLFGFYAIHNEMDVMVVDGPLLRVNYSCLGLGVMSFFAAFVIAFPAQLKAKIRLFVVGMVMIYVLNVLRIAGLGILLGYFKSQRNNFTYHHEVFNILVYLCIFALLYFWIRKNTNPAVKEIINPKVEKSDNA
ncbi:MAG: hypothetical protein EOP00_04165 [Pedobacter sp.]|nr:MAG: hypothetical protein EOP00_04165 [Pedobacter sp.]